MKKRLLIVLGSLTLISISLSSCKKKEGCTDANATNYDDKAKKDDGSCTYELQSLDDHNDAQAKFDDIHSSEEDVMRQNDSDMDKSGGELTLTDTTCATVTLDTAYSDANGAIGRITIDFGSVNCTGIDGKARRGKIYLAYTGKYRSAGTKVYTTLENYYVDDVKVEGTKVVETQSREVYKVNVSGAKLTYTDNTTVTWESERTRTWTEGNELTLADILNIWNDVYVIDGTASGVGRQGQSFSVEINNITAKLACWLDGIFAPTSGEIVVKPANFDDIVVDYGDGVCDKKATITVGDADPVEYDWSN